MRYFIVKIAIPIIIPKKTMEAMTIKTIIHVSNLLSSPSEHSTSIRKSDFKAH